MKVIVTGGAGFIGSHIVDRCVAEGYETIVIDNLSTGSLSNLNAKASFCEMDIRSPELGPLLASLRPDAVIHHAAQIDVQHSLKNPYDDAGINIAGTVNLLEASAASGVRKFIYASSAAVYGPPVALPVEESHPKAPISFYGVSKYVPEYYIQTFSSLYNMDHVILRYANVYGIRQDPKGEGGVISIFLDRMLRGEPLTVFGDGLQTRDFINVADIAEANIRALKHGRNTICNIGTGQTVNLNELIALFGEIARRDPHVRYEASRQGDILHSCLANEEAAKQLGWRPAVTLREGLRLTYEHYAAVATGQAAAAAEETVLAAT